MTLSTKQKFTDKISDLKKQLGLKNSLAVPRIEKVVVSTGVGSIKDKAKVELIPDRLAKITGQRPAPRYSKKSIATFKVRQGDIVGQTVTLRGARMYGFLDKLLNVAIPRQRDFRGVDPKGIDEKGNLTMGFKEHTIFPESADEEIRNVFGMAITIVTTARNRESARALFDAIGVQFKKSK